MASDESDFKNESSRGSNTAHAGGSLKSCREPWTCLYRRRSCRRRFYLKEAAARLSPLLRGRAFAVPSLFSLARSGPFPTRSCHELPRMILRLMSVSLPPLERESFLPFAEAGEIEAAILTAILMGAQFYLQTHPEPRRVSLSGPAVQVHAMARRAAGIKEVSPDDDGGKEALLAVVASKRRTQAEKAEIFIGAARARRTNITASAVRAGSHCLFQGKGSRRSRGRGTALNDARYHRAGTG